MTGASVDPIRERRARIARLVEIGQRVGYGLFGLAIVGFVIGFATGFSSTWTTVVVVSIVVGSLVLDLPRLRPVARWSRSGPSPPAARG